MLINNKIYDNDLTKIGFVLSFMTKGQAAAWASQFIEEAQTKAQAAGLPITLGKYDSFRKELTNAFAAYDSPGDALDHMKTM